MAIATVISITGEAYVRDESGNLRELSVGDTLEEGEVLVTSDNGRVQLDFGDGLDPTVIGGGQQVAMTPDLIQQLTAEQAEDGEAVAEDESSAMDEDVEALLAAIEEGDDDLLAGLDATAAGAGGGGGEGGGHDFVRLIRITEELDPLAFEFSTGSLDTVEFDEAEPELLQAEDEPVNQAPIANPNAFNTEEDIALTIDASSLLANDSDPDGDTLTITGVSNATNGTVALNDNGTITFIPNENFNGDAQFDYTVDDGNGATASATVTVDVTPVNDTPTPVDDNSASASDDALTTEEDTALVIQPGTLLANDTDPDGDDLIITGVSNATNGTVALNDDGTIAFTPDENFSGDAQFDYTVDDGNGATASATVTVDVTPVNDTPTPVDDNATDATDDALTTEEDTALVIHSGTLLANDTDPDGDDLTITGVSNATNGTVTLNQDGTITFTPDADFNGDAQFDYTVTDGEAEASATVTVEVTPVNDAFADDDEIVSIAEDTQATGNVLDASPNPTGDGAVEVTTFAVDTNGDGTDESFNAGQTATIAGIGELTIGSDGAYTFEPSTHYSGPVPLVTYSMSDDGGTTTGDISTLDIKVIPVADTPTASISLDSATIAVGSRVDEQISTIIIGDATGDNNINGSINTDYSEDENVTVDFGSDYAGQTVSLQLDIEINGSWNYDGGSNNAQYFDDFWELLVDGVAKARFFYNANLNENSGQSTANSDNLLSGGDNIRFASPSTTNSNITEFKHTYDIDVVLDSNGKAELGFAAQTTEFGLNGETATITGVAVTNLETYTYKFDVSAALVDTDTSESLALQISGVPQGSAFVSLVSTNNFTLSDQGGGTWLLTGVQNATSLTDTLTLVVASVPGSPPQFDLSVQSIATESGNQDEAQSAISMLQINGTSVTSAPIALDLDDDGLEYLSLDAGVVFTDENSGESVNTAWVGADDGLLVIDANNSGTVDESKEYVFTEWSETAETDMEAVREVFDTNSNGMLDAGDEAWNQFAVWQDANSDGKTDEGELFSLGELGVESIALDYDALSEARTEADGDVIVHGQSQVTWSDGSTTTAEDTSFAISAAEVLSDGEDELFQEDGTSSQVTAQAPYPGEQVDAPASVAPSFEELDTSNNSIE